MTALDGGGIGIEEFVAATLVNCEFTNNVSHGKGGGLFLRGPGTTVTLVNSLFSGNSCRIWGGAIFVAADSQATLTNCTMSGNTAEFLGGGIFNTGNLNVANGILWGNNPDEIKDFGSTTVSYSNVQGGWTGSGNIDADPRFVDSANGDFRLNRCSPSIDAADNTVVPCDEFDVDEDGRGCSLNPEKTPDLDLNDRAFDDPLSPNSGNPDADPPVDMGAYERLDPCPWDLNGDCCVDKLDQAILLGQVGPCPAPPGDCPADFDCDGDVDRFDHRELITFGPCPDLALCTGGCGGSSPSSALNQTLPQIGFGDVAAYEAWVPAASESEAFVCGCARYALLSSQP